MKCFPPTRHNTYLETFRQVVQQRARAFSGAAGMLRSGTKLMRILWSYLRPHAGLVALALFLAALSQVLLLIDPIIFGKIIDEYAMNPGDRSRSEKISGVLLLLGLALAEAVGSQAAKAFQEYVTRLVVQRFGTRIF